MIDLSNGAVANFFTDGGNGTWKCKQTGCIIQGAILQFYRAFGGNDLNGLTHLGLPLSNEVHDLAANPHVVRQSFERGILAYDPNRQLDNPPGVIGDVYLMHIPPPDTQVTQLQSTITSLEGKLQQIAKLASS